MAIQISATSASRIFTEWERRWREEPELYRMECEMLKAKGTERSCGDSAADYFLHLASELGES